MKFAGTSSALPPAPRDLKILAWLCMAVGALSLVNMLISPFFGPAAVDLNVLGLWIGYELLYGHNASAHGIAKFLAAFAAACGLAILMILPVAFFCRLAGWLKVDATAMELLLFVPTAALLTALFYWAYRVLSRPEIEKRFER